MRGTIRAVQGMEYSLIIYLDFGVKACNQRSANSRTARQLCPACDEWACFPRGEPCVFVQLVTHVGFLNAELALTLFGI